MGARSSEAGSEAGTDAGSDAGSEARADAPPESAGESEESDEDPNYQYCTLCGGSKHKDSFSANQRRLAQSGDEVFCLIHTAGTWRRRPESSRKKASRFLEEEKTFFSFFGPF